MCRRRGFSVFVFTVDRSQSQQLGLLLLTAMSQEEMSATLISVTCTSIFTRITESSVVLLPTMLDFSCFLKNTPTIWDHDWFQSYHKVFYCRSGFYHSGIAYNCYLTRRRSGEAYKISFSVLSDRVCVCVSALIRNWCNLVEYVLIVLLELARFWWHLTLTVNLESHFLVLHNKIAYNMKS